MEKKRQEPGEMEGIQGGAKGQTGEHTHNRIRALSVEVPGMEAMLCDPGEPHKCIEEPSSQPERKSTVSGQQQRPEGPSPGWQEHPILGKEAVSMQNEREERAPQDRSSGTLFQEETCSLN